MLYPSLDIDFTSEKVAEMFVESAVSVNENSVDKKELGLYLALNRTPEELQELGLQQYCQKRKLKKGKPVITGAAVKEDLKDRYKPWHPPELVPDEHTTNTTRATRPDKELAYADKELAYGEQNVRPLAITHARLRVFRTRTKSSHTASKKFGLRPN